MLSKSSTCFGVNNSPLTTYYSQASARESAQYQMEQYGRELSAYRCHVCRRWHLSPSYTCYHSNCGCTGADGKPKNNYLTRQKAKNTAQSVLRKNGMKLRVYKCPKNCGWHLTKNN